MHPTFTCKQVPPTLAVFDALKRKFQCDAAEDEGKLESPAMTRMAILGSFERMGAILLEHYTGKWPPWLSPRQAIVFTISSGSQQYAKQGCGKIHRVGFYVGFDMTDSTINKKVREAQVAQ